MFMTVFKVSEEMQRSATLDLQSKHGSKQRYKSRLRGQTE